MTSAHTARALAGLALATLASTAFAQAPDTGTWLVRARALYLDPANRDSTGLDLSVNSKAFPEVDISYFFTPNLAAELVLTYPQKHELRSAGARIGELKHLPPTLSLQYHFTGMSFRPYVGLGLNFTKFMGVDFDPAIDTALGPNIDRQSTGLAFGAGVDVPLGDGLLLNVDVKKVQIRTDVSSFGANVGEFRVDPLLFSVGVGWQF